MKKCAYCGRENHDDSVSCDGCGTDFPVPPPEPPDISPGQNLKPKYVDFASLSDFISTAEGFPYPAWNKISKHIRENFPKNDWVDAFREAVVQWLEKLRTAFAPPYFLNESAGFFLVSNQVKNKRQELLQFAGKIRTQIQNQLRGVKFKETFGKQVILLFHELDDYYRYISHFYPEGTHNLSWGVCIKAGYVHVAMPLLNGKNVRSTLVHELAHNALFTLPIPRWLDEGVARVFQDQSNRARGTGFDADMDMAERHRAYWTPENIQAFWSGKAFNNPESVELSYSLANILMQLLASEKGDFKKFLQDARYSDGGAAAFAAAYRGSLGQIAGIFLGKGDWDPKPQIILAQFGQKQTESS